MIVLSERKVGKYERKYVSPSPHQGKRPKRELANVIISHDYLFGKVRKEGREKSCCKQRNVEM